TRFLHFGFRGQPEGAGGGRLEKIGKGRTINPGRLVPHLKEFGLGLQKVGNRKAKDEILIADLAEILPISREMIKDSRVHPNPTSLVGPQLFMNIFHGRPEVQILNHLESIPSQSLKLFRSEAGNRLDVVDALENTCGGQAGKGHPKPGSGPDRMDITDGVVK